MMKNIICVFCVISISGCGLCPNRPDSPPADRPIYKPYKIDMPVRPTLSSDREYVTDGAIVRSVESDLTELSEYATKLENLIRALPKEP